MCSMYVFGDEAGNLDFSRQQDASQYFIIGTVALRDLSLTERLLSLRRELALSGIALETCFHASEDLQAVRDEVFDLLAPEDFRVDITILEKCKTLPRLQA